MSASEKLKALERETRAKTSLNYGRVRALNDLEAALPQIVAVVEAAEGLLVYDSDKAEQKLESALAALEEALS